jgi:outer membrane protein OmpA-like peptidoglycan-associated protein
MNFRVSKKLSLLLALACVVFAPLVVAAQDTAKPAVPNAPSKWDIFAGYSYLSPRGTVGDVFPARAINIGVIGSVSRYFNNWVGIQGEGDYHNDRNQDHPHSDAQGGSAGLIFRFPSDNITPFVHALVGVESIGSYYYPNKWGMVLTAGGGLDYTTSLMDGRLAIRVFQADYQYSHENYYPIGRGNFNMARLSAGLVFKVGTIAPPPPVTLACAASPTSIFPGEPVTVTATAGALNPKDHVIYSWSGNGVTGADTTATVATANLAPGTYTVNCGVKEGKPGREGLKPWETASSTATFTVKDYEPPTISCSANPTDLKPGDSATVTSTGVSPQNRPLTYNYAASTGTISGSGTTATFSSTSAPTGSVTITCNVADDKNHTATANTSVTVEPPPPPPGPSPEQIRLEARLALHSVFFPTAQPREKHPEGGLVDSQKGTLSTLATDFKSYLAIKPDAHITLIGHADVRGSAEYNQALTERRVNRAKAYLVEQGVPEGSIETRAVGKEQQLSNDQVKALVDQNTELTDKDKKRVLRQIRVIVLAQNRRVDITLHTAGQEAEHSVQLYPFNAADSLTLLDQKAPAHKKAAPKK